MHRAAQRGETQPMVEGTVPLGTGDACPGQLGSSPRSLRGGPKVPGRVVCSYGSIRVLGQATLFRLDCWAGRESGPRTSSRKRTTRTKQENCKNDINERRCKPSLEGFWGARPQGRPI